MKSIFNKAVKAGITVAVLLAATATFSSCGGGGSNSNPPVTNPPIVTPPPVITNTQATIGKDIMGKPGDVTYFDREGKFNFFEETTFNEIIIDADDIPKNTDLVYEGDPNIPTRIRITGDYDLSNGSIKVTNATLAFNSIFGSSDNGPDITVDTPTDGAFAGIKHITATYIGNEVVIHTKDNDTLIDSDYDYDTEALRIATTEGDIAADIQPDSITFGNVLKTIGDEFNTKSYPFKFVTVVDNQVEEGKTYYIKNGTSENIKLEIASKNDITIYSDDVAIGTGYIEDNNKFYINVDAQNEAVEPITEKILKNTPEKEIWRVLPIFTSDDLLDDTIINITLGTTKETDDLASPIRISRMHKKIDTKVSDTTYLDAQCHSLPLCKAA